MPRHLEARVRHEPSAIVLEFEGRLEDAAPGALGALVDGLPPPDDRPVIVDLRQARHFGGLGTVTVSSLVGGLEERGHVVRIRAGDAARHAIESYGRVPETPEEPGGRATDLIEHLGDRTLLIKDAIVRFIVLLEASLRIATLQMLGRRRPRHRLVIPSILRMGTHATPLVALIGGLIGFILALHSAPLLRQYGQEIRVADLVGLAMTKEIGPLLTAILVAGRSGSSLTAEIGTMVVSEEIDALEVMGVPPVAYLVAPRLRAIAVVLPILTIIADVIGIAGGFVVGNLLLDIPERAYVDQTISAVHLRDVVGGLLKAVAFGVVIVTVAAHQGFATNGGASGVGRATTRSVVQAIIWIIIVDAIFTAVLYATR